MRQAELLDMYITILRQNPTAEPPPDLKPELARAARRIVGARRDPAPPLEVKARVWGHILAETRSPRFSGNGFEEENKMEAVLNPLLSRSIVGRWVLVAAVFGAILIGAFLMLAQRDGNPSGPSAVFISPEENNKQVFQRYIQEVWNEGNTEVLGELTMADFVRHESGSPDVALADLPAYINAFRSAIPNGATNILEIIAENDMVYVRGLFTGTFQQPFEFAPGVTLLPTSETIAFDVMTSARFVDGKMAEQWVVLDTLSLIAGLGAAKTPDMVLTEQANEALARQMIDGFNEHDAEKTVSALEDNSNWCYGSVRVCGGVSKNSRKAWLNDVLFKSFPDFRMSINRIIANDDIVVIETTAIGMFVSDFPVPWDATGETVIPATNELLRWSWLWIIRYEDGKSVECTWYWDFPPALPPN